MLRVADRMTPNPKVVDPRTPLRDCQEQMRRFGIHHLPVVHLGRLVGMLHANDAFSPHPAGTLAYQIAKVPPVRALMDEDLYDVLGRCASSLSDACVVLNDAQQVVGILTERDVVTMASTLVDPTLLVEAIATTTLHTASPAQSIGEAFEMMQTNMERHLVVVDDGELATVLTLQDVVGVHDQQAPLATLVALRPPLKVTWMATVVEAARIMHCGSKDAIAVVSDVEPDKVEGLVTVTDLLRALRLSTQVAGS